MTLEHIPDTANFIRMVRDSLGDSPNTCVFFQVPDVLRVLEEEAFWDIYYEHCSYFSIGSLARLIRTVGFTMLGLGREYGDQYVTIEARMGDGAASPSYLTEYLWDLRTMVQRFRLPEFLGELPNGEPGLSLIARKALRQWSGELGRKVLPSFQH